MTNEEYLSQAYRLDQKISSDIEELKRLREISTAISAVRFGGGVSDPRTNEAPFVRSLEKISQVEARIDCELEKYIALMEQMHAVIATVPDVNARMVLRYRYLNNMTWMEIGDRLNADKSSIRRWHSDALAGLTLPEDAISL